MSDIFKILNKIDNKEEFKEEKLSNIEKEDIFNRVNSKITKKRKSYKRLAACIVGVTIIGSIGTETGVLAMINQSIGTSIGKMLQSEYNTSSDLNFNKKNIMKECEYNGIKVTTYEALIEDGEVIVSATLDYSKVDREKYNIPSNKEFFIEPYKYTVYSEVYKSMDNAFEFTITQNGQEKELERGVIMTSSEHNKKEKTVDMLLTNKIIDYNPNEECEIKLKSNILTAKVKKDGFSLFTSDKYNEVNIDGEWEFSFKFEPNEEGIGNTKVYDINNNLEITHEGENLKYNLRSVKVSPLLIQIHYDVDMSNKYDFGITHYKVYDQNGKPIASIGGHGNSEDGVFDAYLNNEKITSIKLVPYLDIHQTILGFDKNKKVEFKEKEVVIDLD